MARTQVTPEMVEQMKDLYSQYHTYKAVAQQLGISASTVSRYLKAEYSVKQYATYSGPVPCDFPADKTAVLTFSILSQQEKDSLNKFLEEV